MSEQPTPLRISLLPMREIVIFPGMTTPFFIGRQPSINALNKALETDRQAVVVTQREKNMETPTDKDIYLVGTIGKIVQIMRLPNGTVKALFEGEKRVSIIRSQMDHTHFYSAEVSPLLFNEKLTPAGHKIQDYVKAELGAYARENKKHAETLKNILKDKTTPNELIDLSTPLIRMKTNKRQEILAEIDTSARMELLYTALLEETENRKIESSLKKKIQGKIGQSQKEYYLNEQMKIIQEELGGGDSKDESDELLEKIEEAGMPEKTQKVAEKELKKLKMMPATSSEANVIRNYIDWLTNLPWTKEDEDNYDLDRAQKVLDQDHFGLEKVKERIIEYIAVAKRVGSLKGPIICLVGPPGVGKTSLAKSIAEALGRRFTRMSLGGISDESEIRGHRRTYVGSMPGKIIHTMKKAGTINPLILLDEIDKMGRSHMGDPSSALLEVLDPEQNNTFMDHYLEVEYDLSKVLFFCTANSEYDIPLPLHDRMEIIPLTGYTEPEKVEILHRHLLPKQLKHHGLTRDEFRLGRKVTSTIIRQYTRESGTRSLERTLSNLCRKAITHLMKNAKLKSVSFSEKRLKEYLGPPKFRYGLAEEKNQVGSVTGLAWTSAGGDLLSIEVTEMPGKGNITLTGKLGDVMKESAQIALSYVRANANRYGIYSKTFHDLDLHVHLPEGATPKDGPSAGITLTTALISALTKIPVRKEVAMTGEITLRGRVLPIGGLKEKLLAAKRGGIQTVLIPKTNIKDLEDAPKEIRRDLHIIPVEKISEVFELSLERMPHFVDDKEIEEPEKFSASKLAPPLIDKNVAIPPN